MPVCSTACGSGTTVTQHNFPVVHHGQCISRVRADLRDISVCHQRPLLARNRRVSCGETCKQPEAEGVDGEDQGECEGHESMKYLMVVDGREGGRKGTRVGFPRPHVPRPQRKRPQKTHSALQLSVNLTPSSTRPIHPPSLISTTQRTVRRTRNLLNSSYYSLILAPRIHTNSMALAPRFMLVRCPFPLCSAK